MMRGLDGACEKPKIGVYFSGGGMNGAYAAGVMQAIQEISVENRAVATMGVSAGAPNAAYFAADQVLEAQDFWRQLAVDEQIIVDSPESAKEIDLDTVTMMAHENSKLSQCQKMVASKVNIDRILEILKHVAPLNVLKLTRAKMKLLLVASDLAEKKPYYLDKDELGEEVPEAIRASLAVPHFYDRVIKIAGRELIDGDVAASTFQNVQRLVKEGVQKVVAIMNEDPGIFGAIYSKAKTTGNKPILQAIKNRLRFNAELGEQVDGAQIVCVKSAKNLPTALLNSDLSAINEAIEMGYSEAMSNKDLLALWT